MSRFKRHLVTAALPYANGAVHIGHLAGVYIPADIYVRYLRMTGEDVLFICGSDEHGVPITIRARQEGITPQQLVDKYHGIIKKSMYDLGISFDVYSRTSSPLHQRTASDFFRKLLDKNVFIEKVTNQFFDEDYGQFLADRYITGTCPHCGYEKSYGDQCEKCGTSQNPADLINPRSVLSGKAPVLRETRHWFLPLDKDEKWLRQWIVDEHGPDWKSNVVGQCKSWLDEGLQPRAVTRDLDWGVPVPVDNAPGKVLYVWFDAPIGYISATKELAQEKNINWELYWKDKETKMVHFIGKDNIVFHCIIFPSMLRAHGDYILPENVPANEFLNLEGEKISTSRNWAVWLHEYLEDFPGKQDVLRYVLTAIAPETKDNDFTWKAFQARNNNELASIFGNFVNRIIVLTHKYHEGEVKERLQLTDADRNVLSQLPLFTKRTGAAIERFTFREALSEMMGISRMGNKYLTDSEPWKLVSSDPGRVETILNISLQITATLAIVCRPFLPFTADKICGILNLDIEKFQWKDAGNPDILPPGHKINQPAILFEKIDDAKIEEQVKKLRT
ncbi:MAG: methionine--tRNA ligase [Bacteroidetes bacterium]|nr:methionine--tRNA ligase [Bacteroidota bacterium]